MSTTEQKLRDRYQEMTEDYPIAASILDEIGVSLDDLQCLDGGKVHGSVSLPSCLCVNNENLDAENLDPDAEWAWEEGYALIFVGTGHAQIDKLLYYIGAEREAEVAVKYGPLTIVGGISSSRVEGRLAEVVEA